MSELTIQVDEDIANVYISTSPENQQKIQTLLNLWLRDLILTSARPLDKVMNELSEHAEFRGLTPEILDSILQQN